MKTHNIHKIGTAAIAAALVLGIDSCAHHRGSTSTPVPTAQSASAPVSLAGKTIFLTGESGEKTAIRFAKKGTTKFKLQTNFRKQMQIADNKIISSKYGYTDTFEFLQLTQIAEYAVTSDAPTEARITVYPDNGQDAHWHYFTLKFNQAHSGTYQLWIQLSTDGSDPDARVGSGTFTIQ